MNNIFISFSLICALTLGACGQAANTKAVDDTSLSDQLNEIKSTKLSSIEELPGNNNTEKLLYLQGLPEGVKSATLIFMDGQISTLEAAGKAEVVNELRINRKLLVQAIDENMESYIKDAADVYNNTFSQEEIDQLVEIHNSSVMRKMVDNQIPIQQKILPFAEAWGLKVGERYEKLVQLKTTQQKKSKDE